MLKKSIILFGLLIFLIGVAGCGTVKGAAQGMKEDWQAAAKATKTADEWIKKNLW